MENETLQLYKILMNRLSKIEKAEDYKNAINKIRDWCRWNIMDGLNFDIVYPENLRKLLSHLEEKNIFKTKEEIKNEYLKFSKEELIDKLLSK